MKNCYIIFFLLLLNNNVKADKIEKKGTLLNAECKPIGTKCPAGQTMNITYSYNEGSAGAFTMSVREQDLQSNAELYSQFKGKDHIEFSEDSPLPADIILTLKMPDGFVIRKGSYTLQYREGVYTIRIQ